MLQGNMGIDKQGCGRQGTKTLASDEDHEAPSPRTINGFLSDDTVAISATIGIDGGRRLGCRLGLGLGRGGEGEEGEEGEEGVH